MEAGGPGKALGKEIETNTRKQSREEYALFVIPQFIHPSSIQWVYSRNAFAAPHFFCFQIVPKRADYRVALLQPQRCVWCRPYTCRMDKRDLEPERLINLSPPRSRRPATPGGMAKVFMLVLWSAAGKISSTLQVTYYMKEKVWKTSLDLGFQTVPKFPSR